MNKLTGKRRFTLKRSSHQAAARGASREGLGRGFGGPIRHRGPMGYPGC